MINRWKNAGITPGEEILELSRAMAREECLIHGSGALASLKSNESGDATPRIMQITAIESDVAAGPQDVLHVRIDGFSFLRQQAGALSLDDALRFLARRLVGPTCQRPNLNWLAHGLIPAAAVLESRSDAILTLTSTRSRGALQDCFGDRVLTVARDESPIQSPIAVADAFDRQLGEEAIIIANVGLLTWGESLQEAYVRHVRIVSEAEEFLRARSRQLFGASVNTVDRQKRSRLLPIGEPRTAAAVAPILRGRLIRREAGVLEFDNGDEILAFLADGGAEKLSQMGAPSLDLIRVTGHRALYVSSGTDISAAVDSYEGALTQRAKESAINVVDIRPRVILVAGLGMFTFGIDARAARAVRNAFHHTMHVFESAERIGGYSALRAGEATDLDWRSAKERDEVNLVPRYAGKVALVTAAGTDAARAAAISFAEAGAHVAVTDPDDEESAGLVQRLNLRYGWRRAVAVRLNPADPKSVAAGFADICRAYGGVDLVVSMNRTSAEPSLDGVSLSDWERDLSAGLKSHFLVAMAALRTFREQRCGGTILFARSGADHDAGERSVTNRIARAAEAELCRIINSEAAAEGIRAHVLGRTAGAGSELQTVIEQATTSPSAAFNAL